MKLSAASAGTRRAREATPAPPSPGAVPALRRALLRWWDAHRRDLPWRGTRDAYRIWVSEIMLQQTRIEVVVPAYRRFLRAFPTLARLARADEESVLSQWSGLGYYTRARSLHRAARVLHAAGRPFPRQLEAALALPGVGAYTAAAVLSIAYGEPHAAVDGNVARVLARLFRLPAADTRGEPHAALAGALLARRRPGDWNQAMMELGQTICTPRAPECGRCPAARWCEARLHDAVARHPAPRIRRPPERRRLRLAVVRDAGGRLLLERGAFRHLPHMWLPLLQPDAGQDSPHAAFRHAILHRQFEVAVDSRTVGATALRRLLTGAQGAERRLFTVAELRGIGRSSLLTKALAHVDARHS